MIRSLVATVASFALASGAHAGSPAPETFYALENGHNVAENCRLHTVDPATGAILSSVQVTLAGYSVKTCNGLARHPSTGVLYALVRALQDPDGLNSTLVTIDPATGAAALINHLSQRFSSLAFLPNGMLVSSNGNNGSPVTLLWAIDPVTGAEDILGQLDESGFDFPGQALASGPDGFVYHANGEDDGAEFFRRIDLETPIDILTSHSHGLGNEGIISLGWSSDRGQMFGTFYGTGELLTLDLATGAHTVVGNPGVRIKGLAFDGATLYALENSSDLELHTLDPDTGAVLTSIDVTLGETSLNAGTGLALQPGTGTLFAIVQDGGTGQRLLVTLDPGSGEATLVGDLGDKFAGLAFRNDGALVGITGFGATVPKSLYLIDTTTAAKTFIREFPNGQGGEQAIAFAPDGNLYHAAGYLDGSQYLERVNARHFTGFAVTDIPRPFSLGDMNAPLALGWSADEGAMFMSAQDSSLYSLSPSSPAIVAPAASFPQHHKGLVFNGNVCVAASADAAELIRYHVPFWQELTRVSVTSPGHTFVSILGMARAPMPPPDGVPPPATDPIYVILRELVMPIAGGPNEVRFLATLDPQGFSGDATIIGELPDKFAGLAFRADGALIGVTGSGASTPNALFTIDRTNAAATFLMDLPNGTTGGQAIAIAPDGFLHHAAGNTASSFVYERIDLDALTIENVPLGQHRFDYREAAALGYSSSLGAMHLSDHNGDLYTIDTSTGETSLVGRFAIPVDSEPLYLMKGLAFTEEMVAPCPGDTNGDGVIDFFDLNNALSSFGIANGQPGYIPGADLNGDHVVDFLDLNIVLSFFGTAC